MNQFAGQQHLRQAVLGRDESLSTQGVSQGLRVDIRDALPVPFHAHLVIQHREHRGVADVPVAIRDIALLEPGKNHSHGQHKQQ